MTKMLTNILEVDQSDLMALMRFSIRTGKNLLTFGPAGIGKTEMAMQATELEEFRFVYVNLSVLEAPDLVGLPMERDGRTMYAPPDNIPLYNPSEKPVVLLVDEIDKAKPELQNPCLELFQFRAMNGRKMNIHSVISTGNLPDENAFSQPVSHALTNRNLVYRVIPNHEAWNNWAVSAGTNPLIIGFLSRNPEYLLMPPVDGDPTAYCHPTPRAWTMAAKDLDDMKDGSVEFQTRLVAGRVGVAAAVKFKVWLEHFRHIEPLVDALVKRGERPDLRDMDIIRQFVCALSAVGIFAAELRKTTMTGKEKEDQKRKIHQMAERVFSWLSDIPTEFQIGALRSTLELDKIQYWELTKSQIFMKSFLLVKSAFKS